MADTVSPVILSDSTDGVGVTVFGTASGSATDVHTASATVNVVDEIWLWAHNTSSADVVLTIEWGDAVRPLTVTIPAGVGAVAIVPGWKLANGKTVKAFAATTTVVMLVGYVNRFTP